LKLKYDEPLLDFAFNVNLRPYIKEKSADFLEQKRAATETINSMWDMLRQARPHTGLTRPHTFQLHLKQLLCGFEG